MSFKRIIKSDAVRGALAWAAARYVGFVARTTRWQIEGGPALQHLVNGTPGIVVFWHDNLPTMPVMWLTARRRGMRRPAVVLASRHRDGQLIGQVGQHMGIGMISGSSSRGGAAGLRAMLQALAGGTHVGLTPDGPRGPRRDCAPGVAQLAALSGAPVLGCAAYARWAVPLNTWDRMRLPLPFGRGALVFAPLLTVPRDGWSEALPLINNALNQAMAQAERLA